MIQLIVGEKGKGKTKVLLEKANNEIKSANGNIVYLDKCAQHMYELNNKIRLIDVTGFPVTNVDEFVGFVCGIISQEHDLEQMYLDSFLTIAALDADNAEEALLKLQKIGTQFNVTFIISISMTKDQFSAEMQQNIIAEV